MKVSIVIICWNDREDILNCIESIYREAGELPLEVIVTDNRSTDGSVSAVRERFPQVQIVENQANLGFGGGNNAGFLRATGEYVLILNPDTLLHRGSLQRLVAYADLHPEAGAVGCRMLNADGSYQPSAHPIPSLRSYLVAALYLRVLGRIHDFFVADTYVGWKGTRERTIGFQAGCCLLIRRQLLQQLGGFDVRLFHQFEDADLCKRVWNSGHSVRFCPDAEITHIGGKNRGRYPIPVILETHRSRYRFFFKHYGLQSLSKLRWISLLSAGIRLGGYRALAFVRSSPIIENRIETYRLLLKWHWWIKPSHFIISGNEPDLGYSPLSTPPNMLTFEHGPETIGG